MENSTESAWSTVWDDCPMGLVAPKSEFKPVADDLSPALAREKLIGILKNAYSGELGAINAYKGHQKSVNDSAEKRMIYRIEVEEVIHRERVGEILSILGEGPSISQERGMGWVGKRWVICVH